MARRDRPRWCPASDQAKDGRTDSICQSSCWKRLLAARGSDRLRRRHRDLVKDILLSRLQLGDLDGELIDALPHQIETGRSSCDRLFSSRIAVGLPSQGSSDTDEKRDQVSGEGEWG